MAEDENQTDENSTASWNECGEGCNQCSGKCDRPTGHSPSVIPHRCNSEPLHTWR